MEGIGGSSKERAWLERKDSAGVLYLSTDHLKITLQGEPDEERERECSVSTSNSKSLQYRYQLEPFQGPLCPYLNQVRQPFSNQLIGIWRKL
jgi:hypothetical protein